MKNYLIPLRRFHREPGRLALAVAAVALLVLQSNVLTPASANVASQAANQPPVAVDDFYSTPTDQSFIIPAPGILGNDTDADGDSLIVYSNSALSPASPVPGFVSVNPDGSFLFSPEPGFIGTASFTYRAGDQTSPDSESFSLNEGTVTIEVTPPNNPPVADAGGPYVVEAGGTVFLDASASTDADGDALSYFWNLDDDGFFGGAGDATGVSPIFDSSTVSAPVLWTVSVLVEDGRGGSSVASATIAVTSDVPSVAVMDDTVNEGQPASVQVTFADSTPNDTHVLSIDWGDGTPVETTADVVSPLSPSHEYADDGVYTVQVTVTDGDAHVATDSATVTVNNLAPVVVAGPDAAIEPGDVFTLPGAGFSDVGVNDVHTATVYWGDGTNSAGEISGSAANAVVSASHQYTVAGEYLLTLSVVDDEGDSGVDRLTVTVAAAQPEPTDPIDPNEPVDPAVPTAPGDPDDSTDPVSTTPHEPDEPGDPVSTTPHEPDAPGDTPVVHEAPADQQNEVAHSIRNTFLQLLAALIAWLQSLFGGN